MQNESYREIKEFDGEKFNAVIKVWKIHVLSRNLMKSLEFIIYHRITK